MSARQGDPISLVLFVLCMKYTCWRVKLVRLHEDFTFHFGCKGQGIVHMCFRDDVVLVNRGDVKFMDEYSALF